MGHRPERNTVAPLSQRRTQTDAQAVSIATVAMLGKLWNSLNDTEKGSWVSMAQQLHSSSASSAKVGVQPKISPYLTFVSAGTATYNTSGTVQHVALPVPVVPRPSLPDCSTPCFPPTASASR